MPPTRNLTLVLFPLALLNLVGGCSRDQGHVSPQAAASPRLAAISSAAVGAAAPGAKLLAPAAPWPGPRGEFIFEEAEALHSSGAGWGILATRAGPRSRGWGSGGIVLDGRGAEPGSLSADLSIKQAGHYALWLRLQGLRTEADKAPESRKLRVQIRQADRLAADVTVGALGALPANAFSDFTWVRAEVQLATGPAALSLSKAVPAHTGLRVLDCVLLTNDLTYEPDVRDFNEQIYARERVDVTATEPIQLSNGLSTARVRRGPLFDKVSPGKVSEWRNITRWFEGAGEASFPLQAQSKSGHGACFLDFASAPDEAHVVKSIRLEAAEGFLHVIVPAGLGSKLPQSSLELARARAVLVERLPRIPFGKRPTKFPLLIDLRGDAKSDDVEKSVVEYAGINGLTTPLTQQDIAHGFLFNRVYNSAFYLGKSGYVDVDWAHMKADLSRDAVGRAADPNWFRVQHLKLIDEAGGPSLARLAGDEPSQVAFGDWLHKHRAAPTEPTLPQGPARLVADRSATDPRLYYYSQRFRAYLVAEFFRHATELSHQLYPAGVKTTQNLSDGAVIYANMYAQGNDYFEYFKSGALDVALSEDWTNAGATRQLCGWNVELLRAATRYLHQPIHMYVIAYSSRRPIEVKLKALSDIAQGARLLDFYSYAPAYLGGEAGWADEAPMIEAVAELSREIGAAEDVLMDATPVKSSTAIVYSITSDIWDDGYDITHGNERMLTYLLLRHAQIATDVVSEADIEDGRLNGYRVAYLNDVAIPSSTAHRLESWVRAGGVLVLGVGAGTRDELNRRSSFLTDALGVKRRDEKTTGPSTLPTGSIDKLPPDLERVQLIQGGLPLGAPLSVSAFEAEPGTEVLARFEDGRAAAVQRRVGKGSVLAFGFLPATSYVRDALRAARAAPEDLQTPPALLGQAFLAERAGSAGTLRLPAAELWGAALPTAYAPALRSLVARPALDAAKPPVAAEEALVEATMLEGSKGFVVPLANYSGHPLGALALTLRPSRPVKQLHSARNGELTVEPQPDGALKVRLPLETTDFLFAEW